jgi:hypothetical protein
MALGTELAAHVASIASKVSTAMGSKVDDERYLGNELGRKLLDEIVKETQKAWATENFGDLPSPS